jgi:septum formation protein
MIDRINKKHKIILASGSPRRQQLLRGLGLEFEVYPVNVEEVYPPNLKKEEIAIYLSELKAKAFDFNKLCENCLVITADTIVWLDNEILPKPNDANEASLFLNKLSGRSHDVITGCTLRTKDNMKSFYSDTKVYFKNLKQKEIDYYITHYKPFDKAGAYGIQEWIGYTGIENIKGSYFNVVGLPVQKLYTELLDFIK